MSFLPQNLVYLRPDQPGIPVDYIKSIEKAGLVTLPQKYLAMYTMSGTPSIGPAGPQGPPGVDQNSWFDTIIASASDEVSPLTVGGPKTHFRCPYPLKLDEVGYEGYVRISLSIAPVGGPLIVDVTMNGVSMFITPVQIDDGELTSVTSGTPAVYNPATMDIPDDAEFQVFVNQVGPVIAGSGLKVAITGIKADLVP